jgi:tRNA threonylcarbamoyladenosine biosynthesis protein TsaE
MVEHTCDLANAAATQKLGRRLAAELLGHPVAGPALLLLQGELGAGKTCLVQGLAEGLGIDEPITSPTFALAQHYDGRLSDGIATRLVHLDLYRLELSAAADEVFAQEEEEAAAMAGGASGAAPAWEASGSGGGHDRLGVTGQFGGNDQLRRIDLDRINGLMVVLAVEWPERLSFLPQEAWRVRLEHQGNGRRAHWLAPAASLEMGEPPGDGQRDSGMQATEQTAG